MTHRLATNCAKNYCNRTPIVKVIVENVVTCFLGDTVYIAEMSVRRLAIIIQNPDPEPRYYRVPRYFFTVLTVEQNQWYRATLVLVLVAGSERWRAAVDSLCVVRSLHGVGGVFVMPCHCHFPIGRS